MPSRKIEQQLELLTALRQSGNREEVLSQLRKALRDRVNLVIAKAARVAADLEFKELLPDLIGTFDRLFDKPIQSDPKCWGKEAIAKALIKFECDESAPFLRGLRHIQMEPIWGDEVDTAATLRGTCALALLQCSDLTREDKLWHEMRTLTDREPNVRADAAHALGELQGVEAALLLRIKARMGDKEPAVIGQVLESLLQVEGAEAVPFVSEFLAGSHEEVREEAALALGACRLPEAVAELIRNWEDSRAGGSGELLLRALGTSRQESAITFLIELIRSEEEHSAMTALRALETQRHSPEICTRIAEAVKARQQPRIVEYFRKNFPQ